MYILVHSSEAVSVPSSPSLNIRIKKNLIIKSIPRGGENKTSDTQDSSGNIALRANFISNHVRVSFGILTWMLFPAFPERFWFLFIQFSDLLLLRPDLFFFLCLLSDEKWKHFVKSFSGLKCSYSVNPHHLVLWIGHSSAGRTLHLGGKKNTSQL